MHYTIDRTSRFRARECASASGSYWVAEDAETGIVAAGFSNESQAAHAALAMQASYDRGHLDAMPQPSSDSGQLDTAEADRIIDVILGELQDGFTEGPHQKLRQLRYRLVLKPRRLTDEERMLLGLMIWDVHVAPVQARADIIAAEVARLWGLEVPDPRPVLTPEGVDEIPDGVCKAIADGPVDDDDPPTLGEVMRCVRALTRLAMHLVGKGGAA